MLQIDHIYKFLHENIFYDLEFWNLPGGITKSGNITIQVDVHVIFNQDNSHAKRIFFYDQEPLIPQITDNYINVFTWKPDEKILKNIKSLDDLKKFNESKEQPWDKLHPDVLDKVVRDPVAWLDKKKILVTSEKSKLFDDYAEKHSMKQLYYFFHGFAALDWYRGYYALNYNKPIIKKYEKDFVSYNRIINNDRSYRIYFVSKLKEQGLLNNGLVSFNVTDNPLDDWRDEVANNETKLSESARRHAELHLADIDKLVIDHESLSGSASASIPLVNSKNSVDAFWHIVTETVFYYDKLHLTEKIFKPIVSKQPFMLLAAPGNLEYLKSYGFKTFDRWIDESYDSIKDHDQRVDAVVDQIKWWCNLSEDKKYSKMCAMQDTIEYNFDHFYNKFNEIIVDELLANCKTLFKDIGYNDYRIKYQDLRYVLTSK